MRFTQDICLTRIDLKTDCILCVLASGKQGKKKKNLIKQASVTPGHVTVTVPGHRGQLDKSSGCPQNRARASIRTGRRLWEQAEVTVVSRVISVAPPDLQELTPIHSSDCLPAG